MSVLPSPSIQLARSLEVAENDVEKLTALDLFKLQMESNNTEAAVDAMKRLAVVGVLSGPEATQSVLLPYLQTVVNSPNVSDEILLILGQQIFDVYKITKSQAEILVILEKLATVEETVVRNQAVNVMNQLMEYNEQNKQGDATPFLGVLKRLASAEWFTAKVSSCGLFGNLLKNIPSLPVQHELLSIFKDLCADDTPMVRRAAAQNLSSVLKHAGWDHRDFCARTVHSLASDEQDSVRLLAAVSLADAGEEFGKHQSWTIQHWLPVLKDASTDMSWRVRHHMAKYFSKVVDSLGLDNKFPNEQTLVMACFVALLTDMEAEVRAAAVGHLDRMIAWGGSTLFQSHLQPLLHVLADDVVMEVRSKCANALMDAAAAKSLDNTIILSSFGPLLESFLQDEFPEVQLQVLTNLHKISHLLNSLNGVVSALLNMSKASNWRVRQGVAQLLAHLAEARGMEFFSSVLLDAAWMTLLLDPVASVRYQIVQGVGLLHTVAGTDYCRNILLPKHVAVYEQNLNTYLVRLTILAAHVEMAKAAVDNEFKNEVLQQIRRSLEDNVPNVRRAAILGLMDIEIDNNFFKAQLEPVLRKLINDDDEDCRQAAQQALDMK